MMQLSQPKQSRPIPRFALLLCVTVSIGYLAGTLQERQSRPVAAVKPAAFLLPVAPEAANREAEEFERAFGHFRSALTTAKSDEERIALANQMYEVGHKAHHQDKGQGRVAVAAYEEGGPIRFPANRADTAAG
jgi:hypothetical protein